MADIQVLESIETSINLFLIKFSLHLIFVSYTNFIFFLRGLYVTWLSLVLNEVLCPLL